jgi:phosphatidate cytidylyltransferase
MLKTRIITAIALIVGFLGALFNTSDLAWSLLTLGITLLGIWEWANLIKLNKLQMLSLLMVGLSFGLIIVWMPHSSFVLYQHQFTLILLGTASVFWMLVAPVWLKTRKVMNQPLLMSVIGLILLLATWVGLIGLHGISPWLLLAVIATVSLADSSAYFAGKKFGRHKLAPEVSPGKTWEGVAGALFASTLYGVAICYYQNLPYWLIIGLWLIVVFSVIGDLFESLLKRQAGIKDSSQLLPGHGGVLDRIDGLIPTLAMTFFCSYSPFFASLQAHA